MKVAIFIRVSHADQQTESQTQELERFCESQKWDIVGRIIYKESGLSNVTRRKGIQDALAIARTGIIKRIVLFDPSRLSRDVQVFVNTLSEFNELGVSLYFIKLGLETLNPATGKENYMFKPILLTLAGFAEMRAKLDKDKQRLGIERAKALGKYTGRKKGAKNKSSASYVQKYPKVAHAIRENNRCMKSDRKSVKTLAKDCGVSVNTFMKVRNEINDSFYAD